MSVRSASSCCRSSIAEEELGGENGPGKGTAQDGQGKENDTRNWVNKHLYKVWVPGALEGSCTTENEHKSRAAEDSSSVCAHGICSRKRKMACTLERRLVASMY